MRDYCKNRDMQVLEGLEQFRYMTTPQIADLYFNGIKKQKLRNKKTSERMKRMYDRGYVQRFRFPSEPFIFTVKGNKFSPQIQHNLMRTEIWVQLQKLKPSGSVLSCEVEYPQGELITDLVVEYKNNFREAHKLFWFEIENRSGGDILEKVKKYEGLAWLRRVEKQMPGSLYIIYNKKATARQINGNTFGLPVTTIHYSEFAQKWKW